MDVGTKPGKISTLPLLRFIFIFIFVIFVLPIESDPLAAETMMEKIVLLQKEIQRLEENDGISEYVVKVIKKYKNKKTVFEENNFLKTFLLKMQNSSLIWRYAVLKRFQIDKFSAVFACLFLRQWWNIMRIYINESWRPEIDFTPK